MVTSFQIKKLSKAVGEIVSGILTIIVLNILLAELAFAPIEVRESAIMQFIMWLFIFSIIWCFVGAVVNIVAAVITKKEPLRLAEIGRRVEAMERNVQNLQFAPSAAAYPAGATAAAAATPKTDEGVKKTSKKTKAVVIAVVAVIIVAAIAAAIVIFAFSGPATPGAASPEQAFNSFIDYMNSGNAAGVVSKTIWTLGSNSSEYVNQVNQIISQGVAGSVSITNGPNIITRQMMNDPQENMVETRVAEIESIYGVSVTDSVLVNFTLRVSTPEGTMTISTNILAVLIEDLWYIDAEQLFMHDGGDGDGDGNNPPAQIEVYLNVNGPVGGNWSLMVTGFNNTQNLSANDVYVRVWDSAQNPIIPMMQLSSMVSGNNYSGVIFNDNNEMSILDVDDEFLLDEVVFTTGSEFKLTDSTGNTVYRDVFL